MSLIEKLSDFNGCQIIGLDTVITVKLTGGKKNPMQGRVRKITEGNQVMIFKNGNGYKNMVNRRLKEQFDEIGMTTTELFERIANQDFEPGPRPWGTRVDDSPIISHKGKLYLECIFLKAGQSKYFLNGEEIAKEDIIGLPVKTEGQQGGLIDKVVVRTFALDSIIKVRKSKKTLLGQALA